MGIIIKPDISQGLFTRLRHNHTSKLVEFIPDAITTSQVNDPLWDTNGEPWVVDGDRAIMDNTTGANNFKALTYPLNQASAFPITFRLKAKGDNIDPNSGYNEFGMQIYVTYTQDGLSGDKDEIHLAFPTGTWDENQFELSITPRLPVRWVYFYVFARSYTGKLTIRDGEVFQEDGSAVSFGKWESDIVDLSTYIKKPIPEIANNMLLVKMAYAYQGIDKIDDYTSVSHAIERLTKVEYVVGDSPLQMNANQLEVANALIAAGVKMYGYIHLGSTSDGSILAPSDTTIKAHIDSCANAGFHGIFFDMAGYDYSVTRAFMNTYVDYAHNAKISVIANAWTQDDILSSTVDPVNNPLGLDTSLGVEGSTQIDLMTNVSNYVIGETHVISVHSNSYDSYNKIKDMIVLGESWITDGPDKLATIIGVDGYNLTIRVEKNTSDGTPELWLGDYIKHRFNDHILLESFYARSDNNYADKFTSTDGLFTKYKRECDLAHSKNVRVAALTYKNDAKNLKQSIQDVYNSYIMAMIVGVDAFSYGSTRSYYDVLPQFNIGTVFTGPGVQVGPNKWERPTDQGVIWYQNDNGIRTCGSHRYEAAGTKITVDNSDVLRGFDNGVFTMKTLCSDDMITWTEYNGTGKRYMKTVVESFN